MSTKAGAHVCCPQCGLKLKVQVSASFAMEDELIRYSDRVLTRIIEAGKSGISHRELRQSYSKQLSPTDLHDIIFDFVEEGIVKVEKGPRGGRIYHYLGGGTSDPFHLLP